MPIEWKPPPADLRLAANEVHLWCADLSAESFPLAAMAATLSKEEHGRVQRFRFAKDRTQFVVARSLLRTLLGRYLNSDPMLLDFNYGAQGKPQLRNESALRFNLAHSEALILYAVSWQQEVGIDVEYIRAAVSYETIAEQFFSAAEVAAVRSLPVDQQPQAFFNCWTRKEAYIKARGEGLSFPLDGFEVSLDSQLSLKVYQFPHESERWRLYHLYPKSQYVGAVAVEGQSHIFQHYHTRGLY